MGAAAHVPTGRAEARAQTAVPDTALGWLGGTAPTEPSGTTWGVPWPKGQLRPDQAFFLRTESGTAIPLQSWPIGYWPDGSLKWSAHAAGPGLANADAFVLEPGEPATPEQAVSVRESGGHVTVDTGVLQCRIAKHGTEIVQTLSCGERVIARNGQLVCLTQDNVADTEEGSVRKRRYTGVVERVNVEQRGPVRAVVRVEGRHRDRDGGSWLPFIVRLYFYAGAESVRMLHTFVFDGDPERRFIAGLGVRFAVPMSDELFNRHVRLAGEGDGLLSEAVKGLTGLRRDPGAAVRAAQVAGWPTPPVETWATSVSSRLHLIPNWGDYTLSQLSADGFQIRKRTKENQCWVDVGGGRRASGLAYVGGAGGGLAFGLRDFWQSHPAQLDIRRADTDEASATVWMWSPDARPMDLRFYHDGMGQDTIPSSSKGSRSPTRTTNPASARRSASRARAS